MAMRGSLARPFSALSLSCKVQTRQIQTQPSRAQLYRRLRDRKGWSTVVPKEEDADYDVLTTNEGLGNKIAVNYALVKSNIVPSGDAYRNLHLRGLLMLSPAKFDNNKAAHVEGKEGKHDLYYVEGEGVPANAKKIRADQYHKLALEVTRALSASNQVHLHDAAVGLHQSAHTPLRAITNCPVTALFLHHTLPGTPLGDPLAFTSQLKALVASKFTPTKLESFGIDATGAGFSVVNIATKELVVGGGTFAGLRTGLATLAAHHLAASKKGLLVQGDALLTDKGKSVLIFSPTATKHKHLFGSRHNIWTEQGVTPSWKGASLPFTSLSHGDLVENFSQSKSVSVTQQVKRSQLLAPHPSAIIFITSEAGSSASKVAAENVPNLAKNYTLDAALFGSLAQTHKVPVFTANSKAVESEQSLEKLVLSVLS